jgi:hypothetical protein
LSGGASLFIAYVDPDETKALRRIVVYDGLFIELPGAGMSKTIGGFLQAASVPNAKMTQIVASGAKNTTEFVRVGNASPVSPAWQNFPLDPFHGTTSGNSDRGWDTYTINPTIAGTNDAQYGEQVAVSLGRGNVSPYDCLSWAAVIYSLEVKDNDGDGLIDRLEDTSGLLMPNGKPFPDLKKMKAGSDQKDLFLEIGRMKANNHDHMPPPAVWKMLGDAFKNAPVTGNPNNLTGIRLHVDVGTNYDSLWTDAQKQRGMDLTSSYKDYLVADLDGPRGGELIGEVACNPGGSAKELCQFPNYPGTVSWKLGFQLLRDAWVEDDGDELSVAAQKTCDTLARDTNATNDCQRRRFDPERSGIFHYFLYAHARGAARSPYACVDGQGKLFGLKNGTCETGQSPNAAFHTPKGYSGVADLPGAYGLITLGFSPDLVGSEFFQASTTMHELGHNLRLWHGAEEPLFTDSTDPTKPGRVNVFMPPQCKPNHFSITSYLYQMRGLIDKDNIPRVNYSTGQFGLTSAGTVVETSLFDAALVPAGGIYKTAWYAPLATGSIGAKLQVPASNKHCDGSAKIDTDPAVGTGRLEATTVGAIINWNGLGTATSNQGRQLRRHQGRHGGDPYRRERLEQRPVEPGRCRPQLCVGVEWCGGDRWCVRRRRRGRDRWCLGS